MKSFQPARRAETRLCEIAVADLFMRRLISLRSESDVRLAEVRLVTSAGRLRLCHNVLAVDTYLSSQPLAAL